MVSPEKVEHWSKLLSLLNEAAKFSALGVLFFITVGAIVQPVSLGGILGKLNLGIKEISIGPIKIAVAKETTKVGNNMLQTSEALTEVQTRLTEMSTNFQQQPLNSTYRIKVEEALKNVLLAQQHLDEQSSSLNNTARAIGIAPNPPEKGWLYVGIYGEDGKLRFPSSRLDLLKTTDSTGKQLTELVLKFDAAVVSDGDNCTKTNVSDFTPSNPELQYAVLRASPEPLKVLSTKACTSAGGNQVVYAEIKVPGNMVRFSSFSNLP